MSEDEDKNPPVSVRGKILLEESVNNRELVADSLLEK